LLREIAKLLRPRSEDRLLLGTDLVKDVAVLEAAYNDTAGVTAEFNRNVLRVINRELDANFDVDAFDHVAFYDRERAWIEMRLRAQRRMDVRIAALDLDVAFAAREEMRTEISAKFTPERLHDDLAAAGLRPTHVLTDPDGLFALSLSERPAA
jgi:L-histidine N-alpha-methyltransferase